MLRGARLARLCREAAQFLFLADVGGEGDDFGVIRLTEPFQDDGRV